MRAGQIVADDAALLSLLIMQRIETIIASLELGEKKRIALAVDRVQLAKRRWRGVAADGMEFGFDLEEPLRHGEVIWQTDDCVYQVEQLPEAVFSIAYTSVKESARMAWMVGNLHFPADFAEDALLVQDDLAVRQLLDRNHIHYHEESRIFQPDAKGGHSHGHDHEHSHHGAEAFHHHH